MSVRSGLTKLLLGDFSGSNIASFPLYLWWTTLGAQKVFQIDHTAINVHCISLIAINWRQKYYSSWIWWSYWPQIIVFWDV